MSLTELISEVESRRKTLTVYDSDESVVADLRERFADRNLVVESGRADGDPRAFAVLSADGEFVSGANVAALGDPDSRTDPGFEDASYAPILDHLDETLFTSYDAGEMLAASREIEDRAWRTGRGGLYAGFQSVSTLESQLRIYRRLAAGRELTVRAYVYPDAELPDHEAFSVHVDRSAERRSTWFVAFDGDGVDANKCALVAEEREPRRFSGFWTYDPDTVDYVVDHLRDGDSRARTDDGRPGDR